MPTESGVSNKICEAAGCGKPARTGSASYCKMHYHRLYRNGSLELAQKAKRYIHKDGYEYLGAERYHRVVYRKHFPGEVPPCWNCGCALSWVMGKRMHIDHINEDKTDNRIGNLRASCFQCNTKRSPSPSAKFLTIGSRTLCIAAWAREPDVQVTKATISSRLKRGFTPEKAVFAPKVTHKAVR